MTCCIGLCQCVFCGICEQFNIFNFLKTSKPIVNIFWLKHLKEKRNLTCEIYDFTFHRASWTGPNMLKCNQYSKVISSTPTHFGKKTKCMVRKSMKPSATSLKKNHDPWVRGSGPRVGPMWSNSEIALNLWNSFFIYSLILHAWLWIPPPKLWNSWPMDQGFRP